MAKTAATKKEESPEAIRKKLVLTGADIVAIGEEADTIEDVYEPYLIQEGYMMRTAQGRLATEKSWSLFGLTPRGRRGRGSGADVPDLF